MKVKSFLTLIHGGLCCHFIPRRFLQVTALKSNASSTLNVSWLSSAIGLYSRATSALQNEIQNSDLDVAETCRNINNRIMRVKTS